MDASSRARSVGVVALGNFKSGIISAEQVCILLDEIIVEVCYIRIFIHITSSPLFKESFEKLEIPLFCRPVDFSFFAFV